LKRVVLISVLGAFLFQALSGLVIVAVFHLNKDYISENLCINRFDAIPICKGSCYLEKQLIENEQQQQDAPDFKLNGAALFYDNRRITMDAPVSTTIDPTLFSLPLDSTLSKGMLPSILKPPIPIG